MGYFLTDRFTWGLAVFGNNRPAGPPEDNMSLFQSQPDIVFHMALQFGDIRGGPGVGQLTLLNRLVGL